MRIMEKNTTFGLIVGTRGFFNPALAAAVGVAGVVVVMVSVLSIAEGFKSALAAAGSPENAVVLRGGANAEMNSSLLLDDVRVIKDARGIRRGAAGPMASAEMFVMVDVPKRTTGTDANVPLRGIQPTAFEVRDNVRIVAGRRFEPGRTEVIVGIGASGQFAGLGYALFVKEDGGDRTIENPGVMTCGGDDVCGYLEQTYNAPWLVATDSHFVWSSVGRSDFFKASGTRLYEVQVHVFPIHAGAVAGLVVVNNGTMMISSGRP